MDTPRTSNSSFLTYPQDGSLSIGGNADCLDDYKCLSSSGGGAGCNPGSGKMATSAISASNGEIGTGGLLIIYGKQISLGEKCKITACGANRRRCSW